MKRLLLGDYPIKLEDDVGVHMGESSPTGRDGCEPI